MSPTSRVRRPLDRSIPYKRDTSLVIIATEGECTEKQYFAIFERKSTRVQVKVLETKGGLSAPKHVLIRLKEFCRRFDLTTRDALWLVIDKDAWPDEQLAQVASESRSCRFRLAVSKPCFEIWLYLHHSDPSPNMETMTCCEIESELRTLVGGYNPSNLHPEQFEPHINEAILRAKRLDIRPEERWPNTLGTHVYKIIRDIQGRI